MVEELWDDLFGIELRAPGGHRRVHVDRALPFERADGFERATATAPRMSTWA